MRMNCGKTPYEAPARAARHSREGRDRKGRSAVTDLPCWPSRPLLSLTRHWPAATARRLHLCTSKRSRALPGTARRVQAQAQAVPLAAAQAGAEQAGPGAGSSELCAADSEGRATERVPWECPLGAPQRAQREELPQRAQREGAPQRAQREGAPQRAQREGAPQRAQREGAPQRAQREGAPQRAQREGARRERRGRELRQQRARTARFLRSSLPPRCSLCEMKATWHAKFGIGNRGDATSAARMPRFDSSRVAASESRG